MAKWNSVLHAVGAETEDDLRVRRPLTAFLQSETLGVGGVAGVTPAIDVVIAHGQRHPAVKLLRDNLGVRRITILDGLVGGAATSAGGVAPIARGLREGDGAAHPHLAGVDAVNDFGPGQPQLTGRF